MEQIADPVVITDAAGVIEYVNPGFIALSGWSSQELLGETAGLMKSGAHDKAFHDELWNTILSGRTYRGRVTNARKDGSEYIEDRTTGLGLATVRDVVERAGGSIDITTEVGRGTMLTVLFPRISEGPEDGKPADSVVVARPVGGRVLLVEDTEAVGQLLEEMLERRGYSVRWCTDGHEAQAAAEQLARDGTPCEFVISDVVLPGQRGPDLVRRLLDKQPELKVVLMSGYAGASLPDLDQVRGEVAFLQKPFTPAELWPVMDRLAEADPEGIHVGPG